MPQSMCLIITVLDSCPGRRAISARSTPPRLLGPPVMNREPTSDSPLESRGARTRVSEKGGTGVPEGLRRFQWCIPCIHRSCKSLLQVCASRVGVVAHGRGAASFSSGMVLPDLSEQGSGQGWILGLWGSGGLGWTSCLSRRLAGRLRRYTYRRSGYLRECLPSRISEGGRLRVHGNRLE